VNLLVHFPYASSPLLARFGTSPRPSAPAGSLLITDTETGPGVFETALAYTDSGRMADNAILFKFVAKSVGMKHGITPTFMAKPYSDVSTLPLI